MSIKSLKLISLFGLILFTLSYVLHLIVVVRSNNNSLSNYNGLVFRRINQTVSVQKYKDLDSSSKFRLASLSKAITGYAFYLLEKRGILTPGMTVRNALSPKWNITNTEIGDILVGDIISMRSGIEEISTQMPWDFSGMSENYFIEKLNNAMVKTSSKFEYSNTSYAILSLIIQAKTQLTPLDYLIAEFPQMKNELNSSLSKDVVPGKLKIFGYEYPASWLYKRIWKAEYNNPWDGAGNYSASAKGLDFFFQMVLDDNDFMAKLRDLSKKGVDYAYGFGMKKANSDLYLQHRGALSPFGYSGFFVLVPKTKNFILGLSNLDLSFHDFEYISPALSELGIESKSNTLHSFPELVNRLVYEIGGLIAVFQVLPIFLILALFFKIVRQNSVNYIRTIFSRHIFYFNPLTLAALIVIVVFLWKDDLIARIKSLKKSFSPNDYINLIFSLIFLVYFWV